jgi:hypothetical protein
MSVYVDPMMVCVSNRNWPHTESCHLFADTLDELHDFAVNKLGLKRAWFQNAGSLPHYDLTGAKRIRAVLRGAKELGRTEAVMKWRELRGERP